MQRSIIYTLTILAFFLISSHSHAETPREAFHRGTALFQEGQKKYNSSDFRGAIENWEDALAVLEKLGIKEAIIPVLQRLGNSYVQLSDYHKAINYYQKMMDVSREIKNKQMEGGALAGIGSAYIGLGDLRKASEYLERTIEIGRQVGDKKGVAIRLGNLGNVYVQIGEYRKAEIYLKQAVAMTEELGDKKMMGVFLNALGILHNRGGYIPESIEFYKKAITIAEETGDKKGKGNRLGNLGINYIDLGDFRQAIEHYQEALDIAEEIGDKGAVGASLGNLGSAFLQLGDVHKAISYYEKALASAEEIGNKAGMAASLGGLGSASLQFGDFRKAAFYYELSIFNCKHISIPYDIHEGNLGDTYLNLDRDEDAFAIYTKQDHPIRLGRYYFKKKDFQKAVQQFDRNRESDERRKNAFFIIPRWVGLGLSHEGLREYDKAYEWYTRAIAFMEVQRNALTPAEREHYFEGKEFGIPRIEAYEGAARCAFMLGRFDDAFYWSENTRGRVLSELLSRRHSGKSYKIPPKLAQEEEELTIAIMINRKQQQTAFEKNNPELLKQSEDEYPALKQEVENLIDRLRKDYPQYAAIKYPQPVKLSQLALKKGETIIEYEVTDPYTIGLVIKDGKIIKGFRVEKTRAELEAMVRKYRAPFQEGANMNDFSLNHARNLADLLLGPAFSVLKKGEHLIIIPDESLNLLPFEALLLSAPAKALKEEAILIAKVTKQTEGDIINKATIIRGLTQAPSTRSRGINVSPRVTTHILFDTGSAQIKSESHKQLKEIASAFTSKELKNAAIQIEGHTDSVGDPKFNMRLSFKRAQAVYDYLAKSGIRADRLSYTGKGDTEPIADNKDDKGKRLNRRVDFVRIDRFGTERISLSSSQIKDFVYVTDEYPISYYQSSSVLTLQRDLQISRTKDQSFFGLGDPVFDAKDKRASDKRAVKIVAKKTEITSKEIADNQETKEAGYRFSRLVNTAKEVREVGKLFSQSRMLLGPEATEEILKAEDLTSRKYVLFSTHGILGNEIPYIKQPALVLNLVGNDQEDGFLTASEIFNLDLNADIVGLSACKTGLGVQSAGEGIVGLSRAFMYAGTDTVLVSVWSVADESTHKLMVKFFDGLKSGKDKMTALKEAKHYLRTSGYDNPFHWAPFILMGEAN